MTYSDRTSAERQAGDEGPVQSCNLIASFPARPDRNICLTLTADENAAGFDFLPNGGQVQTYLSPFMVPKANLRVRVCLCMCVRA